MVSRFIYSEGEIIVGMDAYIPQGEMREGNCVQGWQASVYEGKDSIWGDSSGSLTFLEMERK